MTFLRWLLTFFLVTALVAGGFGLWAWGELNSEVVHYESRTPFAVPRGASLELIFNKLADAGIIKSSLPIRVYIKLSGHKPRIQAGQYYFPSPISALGALRTLEAGGEFSRLTVIEGWTRWDIAQAMSHIPAFHVTADQALKLLNDKSLIKDLDPSAGNLEGYLYPDTYFLAPNSTAKEIVATMVKRFHELWSSQLAARAKAAHKTARQVVTEASIIETEAKLGDERPLIASVINNRVSKNMPLSMDSTVVYASKLAGTWKNDGKVYMSDINRDSPYNTRKYRGLPPGPVGSPGRSSLEAVVSPAFSTYLFYVRNPSRDDGAHNFYSDPRSFETGVQALRAWEEKQKQKQKTDLKSVLPQTLTEKHLASLDANGHGFTDSALLL